MRLLKSKFSNFHKHTVLHFERNNTIRSGGFTNRIHVLRETPKYMVGFADWSQGYTPSFKKGKFEINNDFPILTDEKMLDLLNEYHVDDKGLCAITELFLEKHFKNKELKYISCLKSFHRYNVWNLFEYKESCDLVELDNVRHIIDKYPEYLDGVEYKEECISDTLLNIRNIDGISNIFKPLTSKVIRIPFCLLERYGSSTVDLFILLTKDDLFYQIEYHF